MCGYRQWRLPGQLDGGAASCIIPAQRQRWGMILTQWEKALEEERELICAMDANIDALSWISDSNDKLTPLVNDLFGCTVDLFFGIIATESHIATEPH